MTLNLRKCRVLTALVAGLLLMMIPVFPASAAIENITTKYSGLELSSQVYHQPILPDYYQQVYSQAILDQNKPFTVTDNYSYTTINLKSSASGTYIIKVTNANFSTSYGNVYYIDPNGPLTVDDLPYAVEVFSDSNILFDNRLGFTGRTYTPVPGTKYSMLSKGDTVLYLYADSFDPDNPLTNILTADDDYTYPINVWGWPFSYLEYDLEANRNYTLVVTTWASNVTGTVDLSITGPGESVLSTEEIADDVFTTTEETQIVQKPIKSKLDPITLTTGFKGDVQTDDLSYLIAIPEQWMDTTAKVEYWLDASAVTFDSIDSSGFSHAYLNTAENSLKSASIKLLDTFQVNLIQRVTQKDGTVTEGKVAQNAIRGKFKIRLPIPDNLRKIKDLGIVYIEDGTGLTARLDSKIVELEGASYIEFENDRSAVYGFISGTSTTAYPVTGEFDATFLTLGLIVVGFLIRKRVAKLY